MNMKCSAALYALLLLTPSSTAQDIRRLRNQRKNQTARILQQKKGDTFFPVKPDRPYAHKHIENKDLDIESSLFIEAAGGSSMSMGPTNPPTKKPTMAPTKKPTPAPVAITPAPTISSAPTMRCNMPPVQRCEQIMTLLKTVTPELELIDPLNSANKAYNWLCAEDEYYICPDDPKVLQRYLVAKMYFQTNGDLWVQCSRPSTSAIQPPVCFPPSLPGQPTLLGDPWLSGSQECDWSYITCRPDGCITRIEVDNNGVTGTLINEIEHLSFLQVFTMDGDPNQIEGTIPEGFGRLPDLRIFDLDENNLVGTIPESIYSTAKNLEQLDLDSNQLTGTISTMIGTLANLQFVQLFGNPMTGTIPTEVALLNQLTTWNTYAMDLVGQVDPTICSLRTTNGGLLEFLWVDCGVPVGGQPQVTCNCCDFCFTG